MDCLKALAPLVLIAIPLVVSPSATAQTNDHQPLSGRIAKVTCTVQSLAICKDKFCEALFDTNESKPLSFDFSNHTYVNPAASPETKKMQSVDVVHDGEWYNVKFVIEMPHGTANVTFNANKPEHANGPDGTTLQMSAASRFSYPQDPSTVIIDSMKCQ
jgi:hypothetical protein